MSYYSRLNKAFKGALRLPLNNCTKYVLISDCHRGSGNSNDNFLKNQTLYSAALKHYYKKGFTYIELGDGDELWENRDMKQIIEAHENIFWLLSCFYRQNRLYMIYGNHDIVKQKSRYTAENYCTFPCCCKNNPHLENTPLLSNIKFHEGIILENTISSNFTDIYLTHGHQADAFNSVFWPVSRFLVRYIWKPLEKYGVLDPTSASVNYTKMHKTEKNLNHYAAKENVILIAGHTHRPTLSEESRHYCNSGSCVHPYSITCLEIEHMNISLVKWVLDAGTDMRLYVSKELISGPFSLNIMF